MQEQLKLKLSPQFISGDGNEAALYLELIRNLKSIKDLLTGYHFRSGGRVFDVSILENSVQMIQPFMGKFIVSYSIGQFNACADIDFSERAGMEIIIDLNIEKAEAVLTGEYIPERDPDEF